jgi:hypothetical protein
MTIRGLGLRGLGVVGVLILGGCFPEGSDHTLAHATLQSSAVGSLKNSETSEVCAVSEFISKWEDGGEGADVNQDGGVDGLDLEAYLRSCGQVGCDRKAFDYAFENGLQTADLNVDGGVDFADVSAFDAQCGGRINPPLASDVRAATAAQEL